MSNQDKITALYYRLSQEDENIGESDSITNQDVICQGIFLHLNNIFKIKGLNSFLLLCCQRYEGLMDRLSRRAHVCRRQYHRPLVGGE